MAVDWKQESEHLLVCRIRGRLTYDEWERLNMGDDPSTPDAVPADGPKLRVLIMLEDFRGWDSNQRWESLDWVEANDRRLQRLAFVGEERWRDSVELFALKGLRPVAIEYFGPDDESLARGWLEQG